MNSYELSRIWFDWCFENPERINPNHTALYFFCIEHCNRLGWKEKFGLPTTMAKEAIGIRSYNTYVKTLNDLIDFGFIKILEKSKNQYSSNIIALSKFNKALDKALIKHTTKQSESIRQSNCSINKQETRNNKTINNKQEEIYFFYSEFDFFKNDFQNIWNNEFIPLKKKKKASTSERALKSQLTKIKELSNNNYDFAVKILEKSVNSGYTDFYPLKESDLQQIKQSSTGYVKSEMVY